MMMELNELANKIPLWLKPNTENANIVISSRIRLARNLRSYFFVSRSEVEERKEIKEKISMSLAKIFEMSNYLSLEIDDLCKLDQNLLIERHLISKELLKTPSNKYVIFSKDEKLSLMVNEEDHLRIQIVNNGLDTDSLWGEIDHIESSLSRHLDFAFDRRFGYLTSCPTNTGTGLRVSIMLHLPALQITKNIKEICRAANKANITVRGFQGEGTESLGDLFQVSNQLTLGHKEKEIVHMVKSVVQQIIAQEIRIRKEIIKTSPSTLQKQVDDALQTIKFEKEISTKKALKMLSLLRMAVCMKIIDFPDLEIVNYLFIRCQNSHLAKLATDQNKKVYLQERAQILQHHFIK